MRERRGAWEEEKEGKEAGRGRGGGADDSPKAGSVAQSILICDSSQALLPRFRSKHGASSVRSPAWRHGVGRWFRRPPPSTYSQGLAAIVMQSSHSVPGPRVRTGGTGAWGRPDPLPLVTKTTQTQVFAEPLFNTGIQGRSGLVGWYPPSHLVSRPRQVSERTWPRGWDPGPAQDSLRLPSLCWSSASRLPRRAPGRTASPGQIPT